MLGDNYGALSSYQKALSIAPDTQVSSSYSIREVYFL